MPYRSKAAQLLRPFVRACCLVKVEASVCVDGEIAVPRATRRQREASCDKATRGKRSWYLVRRYCLRVNVSVGARTADAAGKVPSST